jgi:hypothetical protein
MLGLWYNIYRGTIWMALSERERARNRAALERDIVRLARETGLGRGEIHGFILRGHLGHGGMSAGDGFGAFVPNHDDDTED